MSKTDNSDEAMDAKVAMRKACIDWVGDASVLDLFCGDGEMRRRAWTDCRYVGCDKKMWRIGDHPRFVCDNTVLLRHIDITGFNVFDVDAYGSPWTQMHIISARRRWAAGERGAVVITDGTSMRTRFGSQPRDMAVVAGSMSTDTPATVNAALDAQRDALRGWIRRSNVSVNRAMEARSNGSGKGGNVQTYTAILFTGS